MPHAQVNGVEIHYQTVGHGPDVLLVHGLAANLAFWYLTIVPRLAREFRVTALDLRGHGESELTPSGYTTRDLAQDILALLDHLGVRRVHLAGHSLGGAVALHAALMDPARVASLTLADCRIHALQPLPPAADSRRWRKRRARLRARRPDVELDDDTPRIIYAALEELGPELTTGDRAAVGFGSWNPRSRWARKFMLARATTTLADDVRAVDGLDQSAIQQLRVPTLLLFGKRSRCLPTCRALQRLLPSARVTLLEGVGHFFPIQVPARFCEHLRAFVRAMERPAAGASR